MIRNLSRAGRSLARVVERPHRAFPSPRWLSTTPSNHKLVIVFGSQTGTAEAFANDLEFDAEDYDIETELIDANEFSVEDLKTKCSSPNTSAALIMASYGEGEPTDNAKAFMTAIQDPTLDKTQFKQCNYSVFGLGNSQCFPDRYNIVAKQLDEQLQNLGANPLVNLGLGDASGNMSDCFEEWKGQVLSTAKSRSSSEEVADDSSPSSENSSGKISSPLDSNGVVVPVHHADSPTLSKRQLALIPSGRIALLPLVQATQQHFLETDEFTSAVTVSFSLSDCQSYDSHSPNSAEYVSKNLKAGDHIGVFAPNSTVTVKRFAASANLSDDQLKLPYDGIEDNNSLGEVLKWQIQLSGTVPVTTLKILLRWAKSVNATQSARYLTELIADYDIKVRKRGLGIASVLGGVCAPHNSKEPIPVNAILKSLPVISPRLYSLTNDPEDVTGTATLLCRLLRYRDCASGSLVSGLCSSYLCERVQPSDHALIFFRESNFHLPDEPNTPVIMICGGTGIAPFLSFLERRSNFLKKNPKIRLGPAVLYYGCRNTNEYMFRQELQNYLQNGSLSRLVVAFSDSHSSSDHVSILGNSSLNGEEICADSCNITDRVNIDSTDYLKSLMQTGAHVYVCGGAGNFGRAVRDSVENMAQLSISDEEVTGHEKVRDGRDNGVRFLVKQKRYFEDLAD